jgi:hypothetical protein
MKNDFIWQDDIDFCGIVVRLAILRFDESDKYGACISQMFDDEFVMVEAEIFNDFLDAKTFLLESVIRGNLIKLESIKDTIKVLQQ